jgi:hypothetical protein
VAIKELIHLLTSDPDRHTEITKYRGRLNDAYALAVTCPSKDESDLPYWITLGCVLDYDEKFRRCPPSTDAVVQFAKGIPIVASTVEDEIIELRTEIPSFEKNLDFDVLASETIAEAKRSARLFTYRMAHSATGSSKGKTQIPRTKRVLSPDEVPSWVREQESRISSIELPSEEFAGMLHENTEIVKQSIQDHRINDGEIIRLGFKFIDAKMKCKKGKALFILGTSGDGKSTFLNSVVYNMARNGENILYITLEATIKETWESLALVHSYVFRNEDYDLPSKLRVQSGEFSDREYNHICEVIDDIKSRTLVRGTVEVQAIWSLNEIQDYYEANVEKNQYTVVVVDYLSHLTVPESKDQKSATGAMVARAIAWCKKTNKFLLISPAQVNRESNKNALKNDGTYDLNSIFYGSEIQQDTDLAMSVYSDDDLKSGYEMKVHSSKSRGTGKFVDHNLSMDPGTEYIHDHDDDVPVLYGKKEDPPKKKSGGRDKTMKLAPGEDL